MPLVDPSGIFISVVVRTGGGNEFSLWMQGDQSSGVSGESISLDANVELIDIPIVQSVEVALTRGRVGTLTVELGATYELGLALLESELFIVGNTLTVEFGYPRSGLFFPQFSAMATVPSVSINGDTGLTATLNGEGGGFAGTRGGGTGEPFQNMSYKEIMEEVGGRRHNNWNMSFPNRQGDDDPLYMTRTELDQEHLSDWRLFSLLCRASRCDFIVRPIEGGRSNLVVTRGSEDAERIPLFTLMSRGQIDMINRFPILSFETQAEGSWLPTGSDRVRSADISSEDRSQPAVESTQEQREDEETPLQSGGVNRGVREEENVTIATGTPRDVGDDQILTSPVNAGGITPQENVNMHNREEQQRGNLQANVSTIGNPKAFPSELIRIEGLGLFSGNYRIDGMNHRVSQGEWTTDYRILRAQPFPQEYIDAALRRSIDPNDEEPEEITDAQGGGDVTFDPFSVEGDI